MPVAMPGRMAAVLTVIFIPVIASIGFMLKGIQGDMSVGSAMAGVAFAIMASGVFVGMFNMARSWEHEDLDNDHDH